MPTEEVIRVVSTVDTTVSLNFSLIEGKINIWNDKTDAEAFFFEMSEHDWQSVNKFIEIRIEK